MNNPNSQQLLTTEDAAHHLRTSPRTLIRWRGLRKGPPYVRAGRKILYRPADIDAWLDSHRQDPVAESEV